MSDNEQAAETFEAAGANGSTTFPQQASACRKGSFLMIKGRATKIIDMSISKTGKHGHAKCKFTAIDIFDGTKHEMLESSTHNVDVPNVKREEYTLIDISEDDFLTLMTSDGDTREDLKLPDGELGEKIRTTYDEDQASAKDTQVTVLSAIEKEVPIDVKSVNQ